MRLGKFFKRFSFPFWINPALIIGALWCVSALIWFGGHKGSETVDSAEESVTTIPLEKVVPFLSFHQMEKDVVLGNYFSFIEKLADQYNQQRNYPVTEHLLVRANPWLVDSLASTDYYDRKEKGQLIGDQKKMIILRQGELIRIPDSTMACDLMDDFGNTLIDINIPACELVVIVNEESIFSFPVRVGRNERKYLAMAGTRVDLRTQAGNGKIIRVNKRPKFVNPVNNRPYYQTRRDDGHYTSLPIIPWLEPEINGQRFGQLIHPTTNEETLGRAYSNGCIGTSEADGWRLYYYAPLGARIRIRYDLVDYGPEGEMFIYPDIYGWGKAGA